MPPLPFLRSRPRAPIKLAGSDDPLFNSVVDQLSTLNFNTRRARILLDPYPDSDSNSDEPEGPPTNLSNLGIPQRPGDSHPHEETQDLGLTAQEPPSAMTATGINIRNHPLPTTPSSHIRARPQPSESVLRSGSKGKSPQHHVSFSFDERPPTSPRFLASSSSRSQSDQAQAQALAMSPIPRVTPDPVPPHFPQAPLRETSTPSTPSGSIRLSNPSISEQEGGGNQPENESSDSNPFINTEQGWNGHSSDEDEGEDELEEEDDELEEEEDEPDNSNSRDAGRHVPEEHHRHTNTPLPSSPSYNSSRRSLTPITSPFEASPRSTDLPPTSGIGNTRRSRTSLSEAPPSADLPSTSARTSLPSEAPLLSTGLPSISAIGNIIGVHTQPARSTSSRSANSSRGSLTPITSPFEASPPSTDLPPTSAIENTRRSRTSLSEAPPSTGVPSTFARTSLPGEAPPLSTGLPSISAIGNIIGVHTQPARSTTSSTITRTELLPLSISSSSIRSGRGRSRSLSHPIPQHPRYLVGLLPSNTSDYHSLLDSLILTNSVDSLSLARTIVRDADDNILFVRFTRTFRKNTRVEPIDNYITWTVSDQPYAMDTAAVGSLVDDADIAHVHFHHNQVNDNVDIWLNTGEGQWNNCSDRWATITADPVIHPKYHFLILDTAGENSWLPTYITLATYRTRQHSWGGLMRFNTADS